MTEKGVPKADKVGDDKSINFRPSPNFKHMKKYLKSKIEEAGCSTSTPSCSQIPEQGIAPSGQAQEKKVNVQPPLPPNTPPPDYPPQFVLKKEVVDDGYETKMQPKNEDQIEEHETKPTIQNEVVVEKPKKKEMCRDFARGNCEWNPCNKRHEIDLSQLEGVYEFCKDFANGNKCRRPNCRFVHATTFEKEGFFRTGFLPVHLRPKVRSKRDAIVAQPQQQPAQQPQQQQMQHPVQHPQQIQQMHMTSVQPASMPVYPVISGSTPEYRTSGAPAMTSAPMAIDPNVAYNIFAPPQPPPASPPHQPDFEFGNMNTQADEPTPKECAKCKLGEIRYLENLMELEKVEESTKTLKEQIALLDQKKDKFLAVLTKVLWKDMPK